MPRKSSAYLLLLPRQPLAAASDALKGDISAVRLQMREALHAVARAVRKLHNLPEGCLTPERHARHKSREEQAADKAALHERLQAHLESQIKLPPVRRRRWCHLPFAIRHCSVRDWLNSARAGHARRAHARRRGTRRCRRSSRMRRSGAQSRCETARTFRRRRSRSSRPSTRRWSARTWRAASSATTWLPRCVRF